MSDRPVRRLDLATLTLFVLGLLTALALFGYDPHDSGHTFYPATAKHHLLGTPGAWLSESILSSLGYASYLLLALWFLVVVLLFLRKAWSTWLLRLLGWAILVPTSAVLADYLCEHCQGITSAGPGGTIGAWLHTMLAESLRPAGQYLLVGSCLLLGIGLSLDVVVRKIGLWTWKIGKVLVLFLWRWVRFVHRQPEGSPTPTPSYTPRTPRSAPIAATSNDETIPIHYHTGGAKSRPLSPNKDDYEYPSPSLLDDPVPFSNQAHQEQLRERAALLEQAFADYGLSVKVVGIHTGPVITQFEIALETGLRVNKVTRLADDIALNLKVPSVRMVTPIPGKSTIGVEVPNEVRADVRFKEVMTTLAEDSAKYQIPLFIGKDSEGRPLCADLAEMPHLLVAGRTGTGKSVCMNSIILSILMTRRPDEVKMVMIDPKRIEMSDYGTVPHLIHPVVEEVKEAEAILSWAIDTMEERYSLFSRVRVRNLAAYNKLTYDQRAKRLKPETDEEHESISSMMPYVVIFIDEMADLILQKKKEVEGHIVRLAQKSRAAGIHLVVATQRPTVDVVTGLIKSNLPSRICFKVVNKSDSRVVLDEMGAEKLLGRGDLLFLQPGKTSLVRVQGAYASDDDILRVVEHLEVKTGAEQEFIELKIEEEPPSGTREPGAPRKDKMYEEAVAVVLREGRGSVSLLQRALGIGYGRAARLIDYMAEDGIVGSYNGSNAREVLMSYEEWEAMSG